MGTCFVFSDSWNDWNLVEDYLRTLDPSTCLFLRDPSPTIDHMALVRGLETFWYVDTYPTQVSLFVQWGTRTWDYPQIPVYDPISKRYLCHGCGGKFPISGLWCTPDCSQTIASPERNPPPKTNSFQHIEQSDSDRFFVNCCKTFVSSEWPSEEDSGIFDQKKETSKFMQTMLIKIKRHDYRERKETFKRQLRNSNTQTGPNNCSERCKALTKGGRTTCGNKAIGGTEYCGIPSHKKLAGPQAGPQAPPPKVSELPFV